MLTGDATAALVAFGRRELDPANEYANSGCTTHWQLPKSLARRSSARLGETRLEPRQECIA